METASSNNACNRIPTLEDLETQKSNDKFKMKRVHLKKSNILYNKRYLDDTRRETGLYRYCCFSVFISFIFGLSIGIILMRNNLEHPRKITVNNTRQHTRVLNSFKEEILETAETKFAKVSFTEHNYNKEIYPKGLTEDMKEILKDNKDNHKLHINKPIKIFPTKQTVLYDNIYWGPEVENSMPQGYGQSSAEIWEEYTSKTEVVKMEAGCGRMQNRLVTFKDGLQACVRYRQNTDQIQGEIFSFYVGRLLNLTNLAPSAVKVVDLNDKLWSNVASDITAAQWNNNRAVVLTKYIPSLESATIPEVFKPSNRHLNKIDVYKMCMKENDTIAAKEIFIDKLRTKSVKTKKEMANFDHIDMGLNKKMIDAFVELAQWSDLIIFDYLTANLDRIVNNLFNFQWNINIMDGPAHNLARKMDSGLLLFLDNESGLLHGYRLLKKYNVYHSLMLDNLCVFRKRTVDSLKALYESQSVGVKLSDLFHRKNNAVIRDILPPLPEKNAKILHERIGKVLSQVEKCEQTYR